MNDLARRPAGRWALPFPSWLSGRHDSPAVHRHRRRERGAPPCGAGDGSRADADAGTTGRAAPAARPAGGPADDPGVPDVGGRAPGDAAGGLGVDPGRPDVVAVPVALRLPTSVRTRIQSARARSGRSWTALAAGGLLPPAVLAGLESGATVRAAPVAVLQTLRGAAPGLGLDADELVADTLTAWSEAYAVADGPAGVGGAGRSFGGAPPNVAALARRRRRHRGARAVARLAGAAAAANILAGGLLVSARAGLLGPAATGAAAGKAVPAPGVGTGIASGATLAYQSLPGSGGATRYEVEAPSFTVRVAVTRPTWLQIKLGDAAPVVAAVVPAGQVRTARVAGPATVVVGAGGTTVTFEAGGASAVVHPASAPATLDLVPAGRSPAGA